MADSRYSIDKIKNKPWFKTEDKKGEASVKIPTLTFIKFLAELDYYQTFAHGYFQIVRLQDNIIYTIEDFSDIIETACKWLVDNSEDGKIDGIYIDQIKSAWINKTPQLFSKYNLRFLPRLIVNECKDTADIAYSFFLNTAVKVTDDSIEEITYKDLPGHVFEQHIIKRNFNLNKIKCLFRNTPYARFVFNISGYQPHRMKAFLAAIGYLLHKYKNPANAKAVILYDQPINELNAAHGGSGKSAFIRALSYMCNICDIPGKSFKSSDTFKLQRVDRFTDVISLNDVQPNLKFDDLYNFISDDITINKKYKPEFEIKFEDSPKFVLASNYIIKAPEGHSTVRRKYEIELSTHYGKDRTIHDDFGHFFFYDWTPKQLNDFSLFMMLCIQYYLKFGLIEAPAINLNTRRLISELGVELIEYLDDNFEKKTKHHKKELYKEFVTGGYIETKYKPTLRTFTIKLQKYLEYKGYDYRETPSNTKAYIEIIAEDDPIHFTTINDTDHKYKTVDTANKMTLMIKAMTKHFKDDGNDTLALDFETTGLDVHTDDAVCLALCFKPKTGYSIMLPSNPTKRDQLLQPLLPFLHDPQIIKVMHNAKFDLKFFNKLGIDLKGEIHDTMIMDYLYDPTTKAHSLKKASKRHLNYQMVEFKQMTDGKHITEVDTQTLTDYAVEDADITLQLYNFLNDKLK